MTAEAEGAVPDDVIEEGQANTPEWVESVLPSTIVEQRAKGWPDFHPEDFCRLCGHRNPCWFAPAEDWDAVVDGHGGIFCPSCFARLHAAANPDARPIWEFRLCGPSVAEVFARDAKVREIVEEWTAGDDGLTDSEADTEAVWAIAALYSEDGTR